MPVTQIGTEEQREENLRIICRDCKTRPSLCRARPLRLNAVFFLKHLRLIAIDGARCLCECLALWSLAPFNPPQTLAFVSSPLNQCASLAARSLRVATLGMGGRVVSRHCTRRTGTLCTYTYIYVHVYTYIYVYVYICTCIHIMVRQGSSLLFSSVLV